MLARTVIYGTPTANGMQNRWQSTIARCVMRHFPPRHSLAIHEFSLILSVESPKYLHIGIPDSNDALERLAHIDLAALETKETRSALARLKNRKH